MNDLKLVEAGWIELSDADASAIIGGFLASDEYFNRSNQVSGYYVTLLRDVDAGGLNY